MLKVVLLSVVVASLSFTITEMEAFKWMRQALKGKRVVGKMVSCGYCMCHWMGFLLELLYRPRVFVSDVVLVDMFWTALVIAWLAVVQWSVMCRLMEDK